MGYKLKRIMMRPNGVEKQVRPNVQHFSFNFKTSVADWTLGSRFTFTQGTGITRLTTGAGGEQYAYYNNDLDIDWDNVKKITFKTVFGGNTGSWYGSSASAIAKDRIMNWQSSQSSCAVSIQYTTQRTGNYSYWDVSVISNLSPVSYEEDIAIYDFENLTTSFYRNGTLLVDSASMDATKVASLRAANNQVLWIAMDGNYYKYIESIDLLVEY